MRLQKFMAEAGVASRRKCEEFILAGRVAVNKKICSELGTKIDPEVDKVLFDGRPVIIEEKRLLLFHKPLSVVSTCNDPQGRKTVIDYIKDFDQRFYPVGRLDFDTSGLLLLTNNGELAHVLTHPSFKVDKVYEAQLAGFCTLAICQQLKRGIQLKDGMVQAKVEILSSANQKSNVRVVIHEGRNRIVRRMFEYLGLRVLTLKRIQHGPFTLGRLKVGEVKEVKQLEIDRFFNKY